MIVFLSLLLAAVNLFWAIAAATGPERCTHILSLVVFVMVLTHLDRTGK
jgi:hypothetical protein